MNTLRKMNRPIKFFGLKSSQFGLFMLAIALIIIICVFRSTHPLIIMLTIGGIIGVSGLFFNKLSKEHKQGNPDYLTGISVQNLTPKKITDRKNTFNFILNKKQL